MVSGIILFRNLDCKHVKQEKKGGNRVKLHDWVHLRHRTLHISEIAYSKFANVNYIYIYIYIYI